MWGDVLGVAAAFGSSGLYSLGVSLQAAEAGTTRRAFALRPSLLATLARRRRWIIGALISLAGWPLQALALLVAPLTLVQPALAAGLVILVTVSNHLRGTRVGRGELLGLSAIIVGVGGLAATAPPRTALHAPPGRLAVVLGLLAFLSLLPYFLQAVHRFYPVLVIASAGLASAWSGISTKLVSDELAQRRWVVLLVWLAIAASAAGVGLLTETTALQVRAAAQVVPAIFVIQMLVPVMLAPYLAGERWTRSPAGGPPLVAALALVAVGVVALARRPAIASAAARSANRDR